MLTAQGIRRATRARKRGASDYTRRRLRMVAEKVRFKFETRSVNRVRLSSLYQQYSGIEDAEWFVEQALQFFPNLNCGLSAVYLKEQLGRGEIVRGSYRVGHRLFAHTFLHVDGCIIDITADQFEGGPRIYVGKTIGGKIRRPHTRHRLIGGLEGYPYGYSVDEPLSVET